MIPKECKRLAEVDFPIAVVSKHAVKEKKQRHGHPSTIHVWWARRPLGACRSMLMALLLPDPCDPLCPAGFKAKARELLARLGNVGKTDKDLRDKTFKFIGDLANWELSSDRTHIEIARSLVMAAHPEETPLVVDPFAGGGSIPLEALRLGCEVFASDLNPVACVILKVVLECIPGHDAELAEELRSVAGSIIRNTQEKLAGFYPKDANGNTPIAYVWARTVRCEAPNCGAEIPLVPSFWLCNTTNRRQAIRYAISRVSGALPQVEFEIFEPKSENEVPGSTVSRAKATCLCCRTVLAPDRVRSQLSDHQGGADVLFDSQGKRIGGARLLAVATLSAGVAGRRFRLPNEGDYKAIWSAKHRLAQIMDEWNNAGRPGLCPSPDEPLDIRSIRNIWVMTYGLKTWSDVYTIRQRLLILTLTEEILKASEQKPQLAELFACAHSIFVRSCNGHARLRPDGSVAPAFGRHALPMTWVFPETVIAGGRSEHFDGAIDTVLDALTGPGVVKGRRGEVQQADATQSPLPSESTAVWFTDPPYYDAVAYAYLSDFFYVWLKRTLQHSGHPFLREPLVPKDAEIIVDRPHRLSTSRKNASFYEAGMARTFAEGRRVLREDGIASVVFAHKTTEGWEALLSGMIRGGWTITGSWPIATENASRLNARETASLATSVHLVCRPRPVHASTGDWGEVLRELPPRVDNWIERLQDEGVRGADLVFACIGPALEVFSRYSKVETAEGREVTLAEYLEKVWEVVGRTALEQVLGTAEAKARNGAAGAVEEDARLTALFLWTLQSTNSQNGSNEADDSGEVDDDDTGEEDEDEAPSKPTKGYTLIFDVVRRFAQPLGIHLEDWENRIIEKKKGVVRLLAVTERAKQLFGEDGASAVADRIESDASEARTAQMMLFPDAEPAPRVRGRGRGRRAAAGDGQGTAISDESLRTRREATTLDRVHAAMLLQASGRANALRTLLKAEQERGPDFMRLCNALTRLYPRDSEEKRLLDAMLLAVPR